MSTSGSGDRGSTVVLPKIPGENPYSHEGIAWVKDAKATLAAHGLIEMVTGDGVPPRAKSIRIFDLTQLPPLPVGHRHHESRNSERIKIANDNDGKIAEVQRIVYEEWDKTFLAVHTAAKPNAPNLGSELYKICEIEKSL